MAQLKLLQTLKGFKLEIVGVITRFFYYFILFILIITVKYLFIFNYHLTVISVAVQPEHVLETLASRREH